MTTRAQAASDGTRHAGAGALGDLGDLLERLPDAVALVGERGDPRYLNASARALAPSGIFGRIVPGVTEEVHAGGITLDASWLRHGTDWLAVLRDVSALVARGEVEVERARHDALTGLPGRGALQESLRAQLSRCAELGGDVAVLIVDLDRFKPVNDTLGHPVGDALLRAVAKRLAAAVREGDRVFRLGGDEFVIVAPCPDPAQSLAVQAGERIAERVVDLIDRAFLVEGHMINIGASVGIAISEGTLDPDEVTRRADIALYRAKDDGRGRHMHFAPGMDSAMRDRRELEIAMRRALALKEFELHYQPQFELDSTTVTGFEALVRWRRPERGLVSPADFVPVAEQTGLIVPLGEWVLNEACRTAMTWPRAATVSVNVSPVQFETDLVASVKAALAGSGLPAGRLVIEITESVLMRDDETTVAILRELKSLGVRIAMDDFGTGYSSLSYLRTFPFDVVKIDQSFVRGDGDPERLAAIVRAVSDLGRSIGMAITAEGVETMGQLEAIHRSGCGTAQGFLIGRPVPSEAVVQFLLVDEPDPAPTPVQRAPAPAPVAAASDAPAQRPVLAPPSIEAPAPQAEGAAEPDDAARNDVAASAEAAPAAPRVEVPPADPLVGARIPTLDDLARELRAKPETDYHLAPPKVPAAVVRAEEVEVHRLVYRSTCTLYDTEQALVAELEDILRVARVRNAASGVSGALMFNGTHYAQVLEGPREAVERIFESIQLDPRHTEMMLLSFDRVGERLFPSWSMAHVGASRGRLSELAGETGFDASCVKGDELAARLHALLLEECEGADA